MQVEFTINELHTIAGVLYYPIGLEGCLPDDLLKRKELVLDIGRHIIEGTGLLCLDRAEAWDIRDAVPYSAMWGPEATGHGIHRKLWRALLEEEKYVLLPLGDAQGVTYAEALASARKDAPMDASANNESSAPYGAA